MGNHIRFGEDSLKMSNGLTAVFIDVMILAGSRLARTVDEKRLIVWLAEKDQSVVGLGTVGFDIREMPWNTERFEENKRFLLNVIEAAENRTDWDKLGYHPNEKLLFPELKKFAEMILRLAVKYVFPNALGEWIMDVDSDDPVICGFPKCPKHETLLTCFGCLFCNAEAEK